ncbi:MAG: hypothetical protein IPK33_20700 [Gemmatimonadetes bacterium]|jgi:hypothetical protein|nr:hypothetical protein [Gemmatimonadota bacterium]HNV73649.1 hypothetical protein [Gemmatimonadaceae bacterium]
MSSALSADTSPDASAAQQAAWRAMSPAEKLAQVRALTTAVLWLEREGLRRRHPTFGPAQLHRAAIERRLGPELTARVYSSLSRAP